MTQKVPDTTVDTSNNKEALRAEALKLLNRVNTRRAEIVATHIGADPNPVFQYFQADKFEDLPPSFYPIIDDTLQVMLSDPSFGGKETTGSEMFGAIMDLAHIGTGEDEIPTEYRAMISEKDSLVSMRNSVALVRTMALLYQQYENATPEDIIKTSMSESLAYYCATNRIPLPTEVIKALPQKVLSAVIKLWKSQEENHQRALHEEIAEVNSLQYHIQEGALPRTLILSSARVREEIMEIMNKVSPDEADKKRAAIYAKHAKNTEERARKFASFHNFVKGAECFTERIFRFQEGVIDLNNF